MLLISERGIKMAIKILATIDGYKQPENLDGKIWRYMDFIKFISILESSALFFSRADRFKDKLEGKHSDYDLDMLKKEVQKENYDGDEAIKAYNEAFQRLKTKMFISCWFMKEYESDGMWQIYGKIDESIAIQTTYAKLQKTVLDVEPYAEIAMVDYIHYEIHDKPMVGGFHPFFHKRMSFEDESEIRAVIWNRDSTEEYGMNLPVDIGSLMEKIYISPLAGEWFFKLVKDVLKRYGYEHIPIEYSQLK